MAIVVRARGPRPRTVAGSRFAAYRNSQREEGMGALVPDLAPVAASCRHMDAHVPETSPSGALHGMPLACLLGHGAPPLARLGKRGPALLPAHVSLIGVRSFEAEEAALLGRLGVRVFFMSEVRQRGLLGVLEDAVRIARAGTAGFGVSIDLDAVDPAQAPGVGSPVPHGLGAADLIHVVYRVSQLPGFLGLEIAELNPYGWRNLVSV